MRPEPGQLFYLATQGCKVNQYESQAMREAWTEHGLLETQDPAQADIVLINSCAVTERAVLDLAKLTRGFAAMTPKPLIVIAGCAVEADQQRIRNLPGVDRIIAQKDKPNLGQDQDPASSFPRLNISDYNRARAVIKVQDGCSHRCTYCIIPTTRGRSVSREPADIVAEARRLLHAGIRELTLCGINLRQYGRDLHPVTDLWDLLAEVDRALAPDWNGRIRLRLGSLEPGDLHAKALDTLAHCRVMSPHLHLSLQSGSPQVLRRMGRGHYGPERVFDFVDSLRQVWPIFGMGADIIAGFPGESETCFQETLDVVQALPLSYAHVFPYSERPGTPAAAFGGTLPGHIRRERAKRLRQLVQTKRDKFLHGLLHLPRMQVVLEEGGTGMNEFYVECRIDGVTEAGRNLLPVAPTGVEHSGLRVSAIKEPS